MQSLVRPAGLADEARAAAILAEYFDSLGIIVRDTAVDLRSYFVPPAGLWLAHVGTDVVGCIALRSLTDNIGEIKRLYVRPSHRGQKIADALLDALESGARERGFDELYLDTHDGLHAAKPFLRASWICTPRALHRQPSGDAVHATRTPMSSRCAVTGRAPIHSE